MTFKRFISGIFTLALLLAPVTLLWQRQAVYDWWVLRDYTPPASISQLASDTAMTEKAKKIFYVTKPELSTIEDFRQSCESTEQTIVLGCYKSGIGIYVYDVQDQRLQGVQQVTAAHEMLHAAYDRLSKTEKDRIDQLTASVVDTLTNERIKKNIEAYRAKDARVVPNELHSILGTEVRTLPAELELHYAKYFTDRQKVVAYSEQYESEFTKREAQVAAYDEQLKTLSAEIESIKASLKVQLESIDADSNTLDSLLAEGKNNEYNSRLPAYRKKVNTYNALIDTLQGKIDTYNSIVSQRNVIVSEEQDLYKALDTRVPSDR